MEKIKALLEKLSREKFWGEINIMFKDGKPVLLNKKEQIQVIDQE